MDFPRYVRLAEQGITSKVVRSPGPPYPDLELPLTPKDLTDLYAKFNTQYFGGWLPACRLKWTALNKRALGLAHCAYGKSAAQNKYRITIASFLRNDLVQAVDTLLHEMIHIWQFHKASTTGDKSYLDLTFFDMYRPSIERSHRKHFTHWMNQFNSRGFNVTITGDAPTELELTRIFYIIIAHAESDKYPTVLHSVSDPAPHLDTIIEQLTERRGSIDRCTVYKTTDASCLLSVRLTRANKLPRNVVNLSFMREYAEQLSKSPLTTLVIDKTIDHAEGAVTGEVPSEVVQFAVQYRKWRNNSLATYLKSIIGNVSVIRHIKIPYDFKHDNDLSNFAEADALVVRYLIDEWMNISDPEVKRCDAIKYLFTDFSYAVMGKGGTATKIKDRDVTSFKERYRDDFAMRVDWKRWLKLTQTQFVSLTKAQAKKYRRPFDADATKQVIELIFRNSGLV